jgi:hypothetical protein
MPPDGPSKLVTDQASFCLQHLPGASRSEGGHTLIKKDSKWNGDATCLWMKTTSTKGWFWNSGRVLQMACEAAEIPFDQRSLAQCWAIREATRRFILPEEYNSAEPDIEEMAQWGSLLPCLRRAQDGHVLVADWTVWLFLVMTHPDHEPAVVNWYWWAACTLFTEAETFNRVVRERGLASLEGIPYVPQRLVTPTARFGPDELVEHFVKCGLQPQDSSIFRVFASHYLTHVPRPVEPDWASLQPPHPIKSRLTTRQRHKARMKEMKRIQRERSAAEAQEGDH